MLSRLTRLPGGVLRRISNKLRKCERQGDSWRVVDQALIARFLADPDSTFLVSFPRTGSHWLRMVMERYFEVPSLVRVFYYPRTHQYLTFHAHDKELDVERSNVIYLYRDPVDTIYSQVVYENEDVNDRSRVAHWTDLYGRHLDKWLHREKFTTRKTILRYDRLQDDMPREFAKLCRHFSRPLDRERLEQAIREVTKPLVKQKTTYDARVMEIGGSYEQGREQFRAEQAPFVWEVLLRGREHLQGDF